MIVKICGVRTIHHAQVAAAAGADMVGLILAQSKRRVSPDEARALTSAAYARRPRFVGVFVDERPEVMACLAAELRLDLVQLSGDETPQACATLRVPYTKAIHVGAAMTAPDVLHIAEGYPGAVAIVLDTAGTAAAPAWGGTGRMMDLDVAAEVIRLSSQPVMLAGGLRPEQVAAVIRKARPWGVDVSSGVETGGHKDDAKIAAFISAARAPSDE